MPLRKGQASEAYKQGKLQAKDLRSRTPEERKAISAMGVAARKENAARRKAMKEQLEILLNMDITNAMYKKELKEMGIEQGDMTNQMLLLVSLLKKGFSGDVQAVKQIHEMVESVEGSNSNEAKTPIINIYGVNSNNVQISTETEETDDWDDDDEEYDE